MSSISTSESSQTDWDRLRSMKDEDIDFSDIPEITEDDMRTAVLRVGGKSVPEGKSFLGVLIDSDVLEYLRERDGEEGLQGLINETLRARRAKA